MVNALVKKWYWNRDLSEGGFERGKLEDLFERLLCVEEYETKVVIHFSLAYLFRSHLGILFCTKVQLQPCLVQVSSERWGRVRRPHQGFPGMLIRRRYRPPPGFTVKNYPSVQVDLSVKSIQYRPGISTEWWAARDPK